MNPKTYIVLWLIRVSVEFSRLFLQGLKVHGKSSWKKISRDFVKTRTPVQVASHAQKFFNRLNPLTRKKRKSINDITTISAETLDPLHGDHIPGSSTHQPQNAFSQGQHIQHVFENNLVPSTDHAPVSACLPDQDNQMLPSYANYAPTLQQTTRHPLTWQTAAQGSGTAAPFCYTAWPLVGDRLSSVPFTIDPRRRRWPVATTTCADRYADGSSGE